MYSRNNKTILCYIIYGVLIIPYYVETKNKVYVVLLFTENLLFSIQPQKTLIMTEVEIYDK